jgi:hypothetical protein
MKKEETYAEENDEQFYWRKSQKNENGKLRTEKWDTENMNKWTEDLQLLNNE